MLVEVVWTAGFDWCELSYRCLFVPEVSASGRWTLKGYTYIWMMAVYGAGGLLLRPVFYLLCRGRSWWWRGLTYAVVVFTVEALCGATLVAVTGTCPWDYSGRPGALLGGLIYLPYAPAWMIFGLFLEWLDPWVSLMTRTILVSSPSRLR
jgi:uncharacterized membrane protein